MLAVAVIMVLGMSQVEAYDGKIMITNLIFHSFEMGIFLFWKEHLVRNLS